MIRWLRDWRTIASLAGAVLVGLLAVLVITSISDRENALQVAKRATVNEQQERAVLNRRIDELLAQAAQLQADSQENAQQLAVLRREVELLQQQVRDMGGQPVVSSPSDGSSTATPAPSPDPSSSKSPSPRPSPTHTATPTPSPSKTCVVIICAGGSNDRRPNKAAEAHLRSV